MSLICQPILKWIALVAVSVCVIITHELEANAGFAVQDIDGALTSIGTSTSRTLGFRFTVNQDISVTRLGVWDAGGDGLIGAHRVGIWNSIGTLLGDTTVQAGTASATAGPTIAGGLVRFESVTAILLSAGQAYTVGALYNDDDLFIFDGSSITTASEITFINQRVIAEGAGFVNPTAQLARDGYLGPSFEFDVIPSGNPVPEPGTLVLLGTGSLLVLARRVRRSNRRETA